MNFTQILIAFFFASLALTLCSASDVETKTETETVIDDTIETTARSAYRTLYCFSNHYNFNHCDVGKPIGTLKLVKTFSTKPCINGYSYFPKKTGVTVAKGCKAKFVYTIKHPIRRKIICTSVHYKRKVCYVRGKISSLSIHRVLKHPCRLGYSYFNGLYSIIVDHGCSAIFSYTLHH